MSQQKIKFLLHNVNAITGSFEHYGTHLDGIKSLDAGMKTAQLRHKVTGCFLHYVSSWPLHHSSFQRKLLHVQMRF